LGNENGKQEVGPSQPKGVWKPWATGWFSEVGRGRESRKRVKSASCNIVPKNRKKKKKSGSSEKKRAEVWSNTRKNKSQNNQKGRPIDGMGNNRSRLRSHDARSLTEIGKKKLKGSRDENVMEGCRRKDCYRLRRPKWDKTEKRGRRSKDQRAKN